MKEPGQKGHCVPDDLLCDGRGASPQGPHHHGPPLEADREAGGTFHLAQVNLNQEAGHLSLFAGQLLQSGKIASSPGMKSIAIDYIRIP
jgi:hypothetical protein